MQMALHNKNKNGGRNQQQRWQKKIVSKDATQTESEITAFKLEDAFLCSDQWEQTRRQYATHS